VPESTQEDRERRKRELEAAALLLLLDKRARRLLATAVRTLTLHVIDLGGGAVHVEHGLRAGARQGVATVRARARAGARTSWESFTGLDAQPEDLHAIGLDALSASRAEASLGAQFRAEVADAEGDVEDALAEMAWRLSRTATSETVDAYNDEILRQNAWIEAQGYVVIETWSAILDKTTCRECAELDGQSVVRPAHFDDPPPLHPNCRCILTTEIQARKAA
jgi:Phage Mu protein F like protein